MKQRHWEVKCHVQNHAVITGIVPSSTIPSVFPVVPARANSFHHMLKDESTGIGYLEYHINKNSETIFRLNSKEGHSKLVVSAMNMRSRGSDGNLKGGYRIGQLRDECDPQRKQ